MTLKRRIRDALPESARPIARRVYLEGRSNVLLTRMVLQRLSKRAESHADRQLLEHVDPAIAWDDNMYMGMSDATHYFSSGLDAIHVIDAVLEETATQPKMILDLPCGWGRALRFLNARFPEATVTGSDIVPEGVNFCAKQFNARPILSVEDFDQLTFTTAFDLVFVGSLFSHLDERCTSSLLRCFARSMTPEGVLVVTTLGDRGVSDFEVPPQQLSEMRVDPAEAADAVAAYHSGGHGFLEYVGQLALTLAEEELLRATRYGISFASADWFESAASAAGLRRVYFKAAGWDDLQDVHGLQLS